MGRRRTPTKLRKTAPSTSIPTATAAATCECGGLAHAGEIHQRRGARYRRPGDQASRSGSAAVPQLASDGAAAAEARNEARNRAGPAHRRAGLGLRLHRVSRPPGHRLAEPRLRRRRQRRHLPLHLRRFLLVHAFRRHRLRLRTRAGADRRHGRDAPGRCRTAALRFRRLHRHHSPLHRRSAEAGAATSATRSSSATGRSTKALFAATVDPRCPDDRRRPRRRCRRS